MLSFGSRTRQKISLCTQRIYRKWMFCTVWLILNLGRRWKWAASCSGSFNPDKRTHRYQFKRPDFARMKSRAPARIVQTLNGLPYSDVTRLSLIRSAELTQWKWPAGTPVCKCCSLGNGSRDKTPNTWSNSSAYPICPYSVQRGTSLLFGSLIRNLFNALFFQRILYV
jgi:hypothetical protein